MLTRRFNDPHANHIAARAARVPLRAWIRPGHRMFQSLLLASLLGAPSLQAAPPSQILPEPGLYRVDIESDHGTEGGQRNTQVQQHGATGDSKGHISLSGTPVLAINEKGSGPVTQCIRSAAELKGLAEVPVGAGCKVQSFTPTSDGSVHTAACPGGTTTLTVKRISQDVWEYVTETQVGGPNVVPSMALMMPLLENQAKHGATELERSRAAKQLAAMPALLKQMDDGRATAIAELESAAAKAKTSTDRAAIEQTIVRMRGSLAVKGKVKRVMTKIANTCS